MKCIALKRSAALIGRLLGYFRYDLALAVAPPRFSMKLAMRESTARCRTGSSGRVR
jgi:hypothetical protein